MMQSEQLSWAIAAPVAAALLFTVFWLGLPLIGRKHAEGL